MQTRKLEGGRLSKKKNSANGRLETRGEKGRLRYCEQKKKYKINMRGGYGSDNELEIRLRTALVSPRVRLHERAEKTPGGGVLPTTILQVENWERQISDAFPRTEEACQDQGEKRPKMAGRGKNQQRDEYKDG